MAYIFVGGNNRANDTTDSISANNVTMENGVQVIEIKAKGGYQPRSSIAKAGLPTVIRFDTNGTFDCSTAVRIPSLGINQVLPRSGATDINIGNPKVAVVKGSCSMGMYNFEVDFRS